MEQKDSRTPSKFRIWLLGFWSSTGLFCLGAYLYSVSVQRSIPPGDPDQHREQVSLVLQWWVNACIASIGGISFMLLTARLFLPNHPLSSRERPVWRFLTWMAFLAHLSPWIDLAVRLVARR